MKSANIPARILCVFSNLNRGGAESMCMNLYRNIDRETVQFDFVKHTSEICSFEGEILSMGGRIFEAPSYRILNHFSYCAWWKRFLKEHEEYKIVHGHFSTIASVYFRMSKKIGRITVAHSHNIRPRGNRVQTAVKQLFVREVEKYADYCFACSDDAGKYLYPHKSFKVLPNAIDAEKYIRNPEIRVDVRKKLGLEDSFVIGTVGNIAPPKNPDGVLDIFLRVKSLRPESKLLWVGSDESDEAVRIKQRVQAANAEKDAIFTGSRQDVPELLQAMDCFILPSLWEGMPVVGIEAQAAGLPCFMSDNVTKNVDVTGNCVFLSLNNYDKWAHEIIREKTVNTDILQKIKESGYDIHTTAERMQRFYMEILKEHDILCRN